MLPTLDDDITGGGEVRILAYGSAKSRKTWWSLRAAEEGYNVILFDLDHGFHVARNLSVEARKRIFRFDMRAPVDSYRNCGALFLMHLFQQGHAFWDNEARQYVSPTRLDADRTYTKLDLTKLTNRDVIVIDSWTAFFTQLVCSDRNIIDPASINKLEWDDYGRMRLALDHFLNNAARLNCHLIVIGHAEEWAKRKADAPAKAKPEDAIESIRTQVASVSRSHAATMPKHFTDVLHFGIANTMLGVQINTKGTSDFDAGSRSLPPGLTKFDDLPFSTFVPSGIIHSVRDNTTFSSPAIEVGLGADLAPAKKSGADSAQIQVGAKPTVMQTLKRSTK